MYLNYHRQRAVAGGELAYLIEASSQRSNCPIPIALTDSIYLDPYVDCITSPIVQGGSALGSTVYYLGTVGMALRVGRGNPSSLCQNIPTVGTMYMFELATIPQ